jgi:hypothetical protein
MEWSGRAPALPAREAGTVITSRCNGDQRYDREFTHRRSPLFPERRYLTSAAAERIRTTATSSHVSPIANIIPGIIPSIMVHLIQQARNALRPLERLFSRQWRLPVGSVIVCTENLNPTIVVMKSAQNGA